jgi:2-oxoglutarate ferredoxin oxidoreductase subunit beta
MTGGQMAPTSLPGMKTTSSPSGRNVRLAGYPIKVCELIAQIDGATYVARRSLHNPAEIRKAKKAIRQVFENQVKGVGFSLVELLSSCPTNWDMTPIEALKWIEAEMVPVYPLGEFKNVTRKT